MNKFYFTILLFSGMCFGQIYQVKDIFPGSSTATPPVLNSSNPTNLFEVSAGTLLFRAGDSNGQELWKSDGTSAGTVLIKNINEATTSTANSNPANFIFFNNTIFFTATTGTTVTGSEIWKTDLTTEGTTLFKDIRVGSGSANPQDFTVLNPTTMLFSANDGTAGVELWKTDGTEAGTMMVMDYPGTANSITWIENLNGVAILGQIVSTTGRELYISDGTAANTMLLKDINPGTAIGVGTAYIKSGSTLFFSGNDGTTGLELWKTDGTTTGTVLVKDINTGTTASNPSRFAEMGGVVYFKADGGNGEELWKSDGTEAGTVEVADINVGAGGSKPDQITAVDDAIYFFASDDGLVYDLYTYDGTTVTKLYDFNAASSSVNTNFVVLNNTIYFAADSDADGLRELWQTNGNSSNTTAVSSLSGAGAPNPKNVSNITKVGDKLYFGGTDLDGQELFTYEPAILSTTKYSKLDQLVVFPNPSNGIINTNFADFSDLQFELYDMVGKLIRSGDWKTNAVDLKVGQGMYFLTFTSEGQSSTKKIMIK